MDIAAPLLGLIGSILLAIPAGRHEFFRFRYHRLSKRKPTSENDKKRKQKILRTYYKLANRWNYVDSTFTILGALSLTISFILSLSITLCTE